MPKILKTKKQAKKQNKYLMLASSILKGVCIFVFGFFLLSLLIYKVNDTAFYYGSVYVFLALGAFVTAFVCHRKLGGRGIVCGLISSIAFVVIIFVFDKYLLI